MAKLIVMYEQPKDKEGFENHYFNVHIPLAQKLPNIKNASVDRVLQSQNTDAKFYLIATLEFDSMDALGSAMASPVGQQVQGDVANLVPFLHNPPIILFTE